MIIYISAELNYEENINLNHLFYKMRHSWCCGAATPHA